MVKLASRMSVVLIAFLMLFSVVPVVSAFSGIQAGSIHKPSPVNCPTASCSTNWSGYAVTGSSGSVSDVKGSWIVPNAACTTKNTYAAFWIGIDGYNSNTVEQTGTDSDCQSGTANYYAWYEFYPAASVQISNFKVTPGDKITAEVSYSAGVFTVTITDHNTGNGYTTTGTVSGAARSSAEWIIERPALCSLHCRLTPLTNFKTSYQGDDYTGFASTDYATVGGVSGQISAFSHVAITMVDNRGKILAEPSTLTTDGTSFTDTWHAYS